MPTTTITASLTVSPLPDNAVWFANAAAWNNYWETQSFFANIPIASAGTYGVVEAASTVAYNIPANIVTSYVNIQLDVAGNGVLVPVPIPNQAVIDALAANLNSLMADYAATKLALKTAGIVTAN